MRMQMDFQFEVSLSDEAFVDKNIANAMIQNTNSHTRAIRKQYGYDSRRGISFRQVTVTPEILLNRLLEGHTLCHLYKPNHTRKDGSFGSHEKNGRNFIGANVIFVDVDHSKYASIEEYIGKLGLKPTLYYTSYRHMQEDLGIRFRMIYVLDETIHDYYYYRYVTYLLNQIILADTHEEVDDCNLRPTQYFNGTNQNNININLEYDLTGYIYSLSDFNTNKETYIDFLCNLTLYESDSTIYKHLPNIIDSLYTLTNINYTFNNSTKTIQPTTINDSMENRFNPWGITCELSLDQLREGYYSRKVRNILLDWDRLEEEEFIRCSEWINARKNTHYVYRVEKEWINNLFQFVNDDYFALFFFTETQFDKMHRRKTLFQRMCLRRVMKPNITMDELVINTIIEILKHFDNSDRVLNSEFIMDKVEKAFAMSIDEIVELNKNTISWLKEKTRPKDGIIYINRKARCKDTSFQILDSVYDNNLSINENYANINVSYQFKISKSLLYEYIRSKGIKSNNKKLSDEELINFIDVNLSVRSNRQLLKQQNIQCGDERLRRIINLMKQGFNFDNLNNNNNKTTTINGSVENRFTHYEEYVEGLNESEENVEPQGITEYIDNTIYYYQVDEFVMIEYNDAVRLGMVQTNAESAA